MRLAIDIGSKYIRLIEGEINKKGIEVRQKSKIKVPTGYIVDGEVLDKDSIVQLLKQEIKDRDYKSKRVHMTFSTTHLVTRELVTPKIKRKQIREVLTQELSGVIGSWEEYIIDYKILEDQEASGMKLKVVLVPRRVVEIYKEMIEAIGCYAEKLTVHPNVLDQIVKAYEAKQNNSVIVADIGNSYMNFHLFDDNQRTFSRNLIINTEQYAETLLSLGQIEDTGESFQELDFSPRALEENIILFNTLSTYLNNIVDQLQNMMQFQLNINSHHPVRRIYLVGGMSYMKGIKEYIESYLDVNVYTGQELDKKSGIDGLAEYLNAVGLLLDSKKKQINFFKMYRQEVRDKKRPSKQNIIGSLVLSGQVIVLITIIILQIAATQAVRTEQEAIKSYLSIPETKGQLEELYNKKLEGDRVAQKSLEVERVGEVIRQVPRLDHNLLNSIAAQMSGNLKISQFSYLEGVISLTCEVEQEADVVSFVHYLRNVNGIQKVSYTGYQLSSDKYIFNLILSLNGGSYHEND